MTSAGSITTAFLRRIGSLVFVGGLLAGCTANTDFDRLRPMLVTDNIHAWVGASAAQTAGLRSSKLPTDRRRAPDARPRVSADRTALRSQPLVQRPERIWADPRVQARLVVHRRHGIQQRVDGEALPVAAGRYEKVNDDVRNDVVRIPPFFDVARRVLDIDKRREKALSLVGGLNEYEAGNARSRMAENFLVVAWVQCSLAHRGASYRFALERLVIESPTSMAVEVDRSLKLMQIAPRKTASFRCPSFAR